MGAQTQNPVIDGAFNGLMVGVPVGMGVGAHLGRKKRMELKARGFRGALTGGTAAGALGAGAGALASAMKETSLREGAENCVALQTDPNFNLSSYISADWYPQYQNEQQYQKKDEMNCTVASYSLRDERWPPPFKYGIDVLNRAYKADGVTVNDGGKLCAIQEDGARLAVAPCFIPSTMAGPYVVLNYSSSAGTAIILGGQPNKYNATTGLCGYRNALQNGMWIFARNRVPTGAMLASVNALKAYMQDVLRIDTSNMLRTPQTNCDGFPPAR